MDPPQCIQNAMMTKDKKPFTYTPGGIDLSEVRSPRMARRIEHNANLGGVGDIPKPQHPQPVNYGPLPPSTLAAMRPQPQVQVFPSGPPPSGPIKPGSAAPPPPPPMNMPPPPPPPSGPLPTQKVRTSDNQTLERPDMTKIIPDNPMALLRKTGGPAPRKSLVDEMFDQAGKGAPQPSTPPSIVQRPQYEPEQQRYQPPVIERAAPVTTTPHQPQSRLQSQPQPPRQQYQPPQQQYSPEEVKEQPRYQDPPRYQPPVIERKPTIKQNNDEPEIKTSTAHLGSLYIPPANQQQTQKRVVSPPSPPERSQNNPGLQTPPLKEAPRPWQTKKPQQEELPPWTKRDNQVTNREDAQNNTQASSPPVQQQQKQPSQRWPQSKPAQQIQPNQQYPYNQQPEYIDPPYQPPQYNQQNYQQPSFNQQNRQEPIGLRIEIRTNPTPGYADDQTDKKPNAVYVTQPLVFQHPGPKPQVVDNQGARVVSEGSRQGSKTPSTPGNERSLNRQQSWGSNPTQSNSFKLIQKITQTEEDEDEDESIPITEHSPKFPQQFQQPAEHMRRMKIEGDASMANRFKQAPSGPQTQNRQPHVRTIPIQIEDDEPPKKYVHPSEQVVPEPKKYTGSSIPSRSFKILQAMTAPPDNCANVDDQNEASLYDQWGYDVSHYHPHPYPPPPYWLDYYHNYYYPDPNSEFSRDEAKASSVPKVRAPTPTARVSTPTPASYWGYSSSYSRPKSKNIPEESNTNPRNTPLSFSSSYNYYPKNSTDEDTTNDEYEFEEEAYSYFPPYYDPYYYHYYYGYPQMYHPYPYYGMSETEEFAGYYSTDDTYTNSNKKTRTKTNMKRRNSTGDIKGMVTPTLYVKEQIQNIPKPGIEADISDSETESDDTEKQQAPNPLQSIKSVNNITVYDEGTSDHEVLVEECSENDDTDEEQSFEDEAEAYPHQLSVIMEESERTESRIRSASVLSDSTTIADKSDVEDEEPQLATIPLPLKICVNITDENQKDIKKQILFEGGNIKTFDPTNTTVFTLKAPNIPPCSIPNQNVALERKNSLKNISDSNKTESVNETDEADERGSTESEDWWGILGEDDDLPKPRTAKRKQSTDLEEINYFQENSTCEDNNNLINTNTSYEEINPQISLDMCSNKQPSNSNNDNNTAVVINNVPEVTGVVLRRKKVDVDLDLTTTYKRRSVYDLEDEEEVNAEGSGKILEMESFVEQFEEIKRNSGLWNFNLKDFDNNTDSNQNNDENFENNSSDQNKFEFWESIKYEKDKLDEIVSKDYKDEIQGSANYSKYNSSKSSLKEQSQNISEVNSNAIETYESNKDDSESDESSESESSSSDDEEDAANSPKQNNDGNRNEETELKLLTVQERIKALRESIKEKQNKLLEKENKLTVKEKVAAIEQSNQSRSKTASTKSSLKSFEEISEEEEEVDSGVTSDMSRHISDSEEFPELKKLTKYQRAATHSRLFKLLQEQCDNEDEEQEIADENIEKFSKLSVRQNGSPRKLSPRRDLLTLPLNKYSESESISSNSGRNSPTSVVNEKLVTELIQSLLKCRKGQIFRNMPKEKLYAAAVKILQEDLDGTETPSDYGSFMSPLRGSTGSSTAAQTPQEFNSNFDEYKQYYQSWDEAERLHRDNNDTLPSKALKLLQDSDLNKTGPDHTDF